MLRLTEDQINSLDIAEAKDKPRCVIDGAAGTGKTVLAMELAKSRCEDGETVALLCSNPNLIRHLEPWAKKISDDGSKGGARLWQVHPRPYRLGLSERGSDSLARHQQRLADSPELEKSLQFGHLDDEWFSFVDDTIKDLGQGGIFDYLIVDEAQNLCDEIFLKLMDALLKGGLTGGRFTMFGDFTNQNIVTQIKDGKKALKNFIKSRGLRRVFRPTPSKTYWEALKNFIKNRDLPSITLSNNCRNTYEIAWEVAALTNIDSPPISGVYGPDVQIEYFKSKEELQELLDGKVKGFITKGFHSSQIILLYDYGFAHAGCYGGWKLRNINIRESEKQPPTDPKLAVIPQDTTSNDILRCSDIYDFQGLESEVANSGYPCNSNYDRRCRYPT